MNLFQLHFTSYWGTSIIFYIFDLIVYKNRTTELYKQNKITKIYWKYCHDSAKAALFNQIFITYPIILIIEKNLISNNLNIIREGGQILLYYILADMYFFTLHYMCHKSPFLYQNIHKFHHRVFSTCAVAALDANPIEHLFINIGSFVLGPLLLSGHIQTIKVWIILATINTCISHSGYNHFLVGKEHNLHHRLSKHNYGQGLYLCDKFFGTHRKEYNN